MIQQVRSFLTGITATLGLAMALAVPQAHAGMIQVEDLERERVKSMLERPEVAQELQKMGIPADEARVRVDAMTAAEVRQLSGRLDALPAGGQTSTQNLLLVIIVILLILIII